MDLIEALREMARNNAWANARLYKACLAMSAAEFAAPRLGFFPSLSLTLNHNLIVDWLYLDALVEGGKGRATTADEEPYPDCAELWQAQHKTDLALVAHCDALDAALLARPVHLDRGERGIMTDRRADVLLHLFQHQIHHRGQAHNMLSQAGVHPPQLDEYFLSEDWKARDPELKDLGLR